MTDQTPDTTPEQQEPFVPPRYLLAIAGGAFLAAIAVALTQADFGVVGYGALALGLLALLGWALMAPDEARAALTGRTARYGGLGFFVTVVVLVALVMVYILVRNQNWRVDLTEGDDFSLTEASADAIETLGADPTVSSIRVLAFYGLRNAAMRDRDSVLLEDYVATSGGKISYEFVDPDRNPQIAQQYGITNEGQFAIVPLGEDGAPVVAEAETVTFFSQDELTNAILKVSAGGDFRLYVINAAGAVTLQPSEAGSMNQLTQPLVSQLDWSVDEISFLDALRAQDPVRFDDAGTDGQVVMIVGGSRPLSEQEMDVLTEYVEDGGDLVIFADTPLVPDSEPLATGPALSDFLYENFGMRVRGDLVVDPEQSLQNLLLFYTTNLNAEHFITTSGMPPDSPVILQYASSIELAENPPDGVTVTPLIVTSAGAYAKTDLDAIAEEGALDQTEADLQGPLVLGAVAENSATGARVVLFGSTALVQDALASAALGQTLVANLQVVYNTLFWATDYNDFFQRTTIVSEQRPQDIPVFAEPQTLRMVNFLTMIVLPFGVLVLGILVWWNSRERERT